MATLYITEPGARLEREYRHLLVVKDDETLLRVPLAEVGQVVLVGQGVGATTPALHALLEAGAGLSLVRATGELVGRLAPPTGKNLDLRRQQYARAAESDFCLALSRQIVLGKLRNCQALALRWSREDRPAAVEGELARIAASLSQAETASDLATLRGAEGMGSKAYFAVYRGRLNPAFTFEKRTRRPPRDPVNALLSLGYTLLGEAVATALEVVGLDAYEGFYHADKYGRPSLALDMVEEFRGPVVDAVVLTLVNKRVLQPADFDANEATGGIYLGRAGLARFLEEFSQRLQAKFTHPLAGRPLTYQKCLEVQARLLAKVIMGEANEYHALRVR
jgi:CRISP-associated protein Cas1